MSGKRPRRETKKAKATARPRPKSPARKSSDAKLYGGIAALVVGLAALVWWSLPGNHAPDVGGAGVPDEDPASEATGPEAGRSSERGLTRPPRAAAELAVVTDKPDDEIAKVATTTEIARRLGARHCGDACDAVRKFMSDEDGFEIEIAKTEDLLLPPKDTLDTVAPGLTPSQRASVHDRTSSPAIRLPPSSASQRSRRSTSSCSSIARTTAQCACSRSG
ncbi:MAG: hypothetical protein K0S65_6555 [Labilithrix sp.]|nr:hypothetical protein [Labilithrix sp.]